MHCAADRARQLASRRELRQTELTDKATADARDIAVSMSNLHCLLYSLIELDGLPTTLFTVGTMLGGSNT